MIKIQIIVDKTWFPGTKVQPISAIKHNTLGKFTLKYITTKQIIK